jgi:hypothetical protein
VCGLEVCHAELLCEVMILAGLIGYGEPLRGEGGAGAQPRMG